MRLSFWSAKMEARNENTELHCTDETKHRKELKNLPLYSVLWIAGQIHLHRPVSIVSKVVSWHMGIHGSYLHRLWTVDTVIVPNHRRNICEEQKRG